VKPFVFCPACGGELEGADAEGGTACPACGRSWYRNPAPTAGAVIVHDGRALVTVRASEPEKGRIDIVGGFLKYYEDPVTALKREIEEEIAVEVDVSFEDIVQAVPHEYGNGGDWVLAMGFAARLVSGEPRPGDDVAAIRWITESEIDELDWAWEHDRELVRKVLKRHG
jgi:ADP-ribose pyrophosphatase YjhB (NUDIX family)